MASDFQVASQYSQREQLALKVFFANAYKLKEALLHALFPTGPV
jgi:hypothetical protein